ncbi:MAG: hypothetical protein JWP91_2051 [Fibrobacteres bacterium]|nr:hypothetical protein [Fibrobacterota bacterium]
MLSGAAEAAVGFRWDFTGTVRLRVLDGRRRPVGVLSAEGKVTGGISFTYSHRAGAGTPEPAPGRDFLREGTVWLGGDGNARERADIGAQIPAIRVDWAPEEVSAAEAEQDRRAAVMDRDIEADFRARMDAVRKKRGAR